MELKKLLKNLVVKTILQNKNIPFIDSEIVETIKLSSAFQCICEKIILKNNKKLVVKAQILSSENQYTSIYFEGKSLQFLNKKFGSVFPKVHHLEKDFFIMDWIEHNNKIDYFSEKDLAKKISAIHSFKNDKFGFYYNSPIGGIEQPSKPQKNWVEFYKINRLQMIFDKINNTNPLPNDVNKGIEKIINNLNNYLPDSSSPSLIHGDLWQGNILFNNGILVGLIDPGIYFADVELELSSLRFLNVVSNNFFTEYQKYIKLEKDFLTRSGIYELYYALLNVHLWSKEYINKTREIIKKYV